MNKPTQEDIEDAISGDFNPEWSRAILVDAYRAELNANKGETAYQLLLERQYNEIKAWIDKAAYDMNPPDLESMLARHEFERKEANLG